MILGISAKVGNPVPVRKEPCKWELYAIALSVQSFLHILVICEVVPSVRTTEILLLQYKRLEFSVKPRRFQETPLCSLYHPGHSSQPPWHTVMGNLQAKSSSCAPATVAHCDRKPTGQVLFVCSSVSPFEKQ